MDCDSFNMFARRVGDDKACALIERICEQHYASEDGNGVEFTERTSCDREGANYTLTGTVNWHGEFWYFEIRDGNWNGTVIDRWEYDGSLPWLEPEPAEPSAIEKLRKLTRV